MISNQFATWLYQVFANGPSQYHRASAEKREEMEIAFLSDKMPHVYILSRCSMLTEQSSISSMIHMFDIPKELLLLRWWR